MKLAASGQCLTGSQSLTRSANQITREPRQSRTCATRESPPLSDAVCVNVIRTSFAVAIAVSLVCAARTGGHLKPQWLTHRYPEPNQERLACIFRYSTRLDQQVQIVSASKLEAKRWQSMRAARPKLAQREIINMILGRYVYLLGLFELFRPHFLAASGPKLHT